MTRGNRVLDQLEEVGAITRGHFVLSSGRHSDIYVEKFRVLEHPGLTQELATQLAEGFEEDAEVVLAPAVGGIVWGFAVATALRARFVFSEREEGRMRLRRGFHIEAGERVVVVEDIVTTGGSLKEVLEVAEPGKLVGIGCLVDRSGGLDLPLELSSLARLPAESWPSEQCPLCAQGIPTGTPGSRHLG